MAGKMRKPAGFTLIELMIVIAMAGILLAVAAVSYRKISYVHEIQTDLDQMIAYLQEKRLKAFAHKTPIVITVAANQLTNGFDSEKVDLKNSFTSSSPTFTINRRGLFSTVGFIRLVNPGTEYSCINIASSSVREGKWNGTSCDAK